MNAIKKFAKDVQEGLTSNPKYLPSMYFYDETGDKLFQEIMGLSEYYLTDSEFEILFGIKDQILTLLNRDESFNLIELGAGDGYKTKILLHHFIEKKIRFEYIPIDISKNAVVSLVEDVEKSLNGIQVKGIVGEYFEMLDEIKNHTRFRNLILFLGSNIGNFNFEQAADFLRRLNSKLKKNDLVLIGFDLQKDPQTILNAYNDKAGVTRDFNLNLLTRINRELGADFNTNNFYHYPVYDPHAGEARSYLVSKMAQTVYIKELNQNFDFQYGEFIFTEISKKFNISQIEQLAELSGFNVEKDYFDSKKYFVDSMWRVK
ncbi:L-histidine N(alpha)-methyltransferase [Bacteroidota bacterium]